MVRNYKTGTSTTGQLDEDGTGTEYDWRSGVSPELPLVDALFNAHPPFEDVWQSVVTFKMFTSFFVRRGSMNLENLAGFHQSLGPESRD